MLILSFLLSIVSALPAPSESTIVARQLGLLPNVPAAIPKLPGFPSFHFGVDLALGNGNGFALAVKPIKDKDGNNAQNQNVIDALLKVLAELRDNNGKAN